MKNRLWVFNLAVLAVLLAGCATAPLTVQQRAVLACEGYTSALSGLTARYMAGELGEADAGRVDESLRLVEPLCLAVDQGDAVTANMLDQIEQYAWTLIELDRRSAP